MADGVGLSVGATNLAAVVVGRTAVTRSSVLTLYPHRPPEVGVPSENPNLNEPGLIITDFVDRVGDPVGIVASDGSTHRGEVLLGDALGALLNTATRGHPPAEPVGVTYPAHWRPSAVTALRNALASVPALRGPASVVSDASAALTALHDDPGVPTRGVIALCDFGGSGTSITLVDAADGYQPIGPTVRHTDLSGDLIDQALLTHVINDLSAAGSVDLPSTSAIGALTRLRGQCRTAKERLSTTAVTSLVAELPGHRSDVRLTRNELDDAIRQPLTDFVGVLQETLHRSGIRPGDLVAVASAGGGARIPIITTMLSEQFRVPVITTPRPELTAAIGAGLTAVRGMVDEGVTSMAAAAPVTAAAALAVSEPAEMEGSSTFRALAWSEADDSPDVVATDPYDYPPVDAGGGFTDARPPIQFGEREQYEVEAAAPWYRRPAVALGAAVIALLAALAAAFLFVTRDEDTPAPASTTTPVTTTTAPPVAPPPAEPPPAEVPAEAPPPPQQQAPPPRTVTRTAPPPATQAPPPPPPATTEAPPPPPPATTEAPPPAPPTTEAPPPAPPTTEAPPPPTTTRPRWSPTPPYPTIPGLPWVPAPQPPQPAP